MRTPEGHPSGVLLLDSASGGRVACEGPRIVVQDRRQPAFTLRHAPALAAGIVFDLVALDLADAEVVAVRVAEIEPAHRGAWPHREALGQRDADPLAAKQREQRALLGVIRLRRIARRRTNALVFL